MLKINLFRIYIIIQLLSSQLIHTSTSLTQTPPEQILTQKKFLQQQRIAYLRALAELQEDTTCSMYDRDIIVARPAQTDMDLEGGFSLFSHPIIIETDHVLKNTCTAQIVEQTLEIIEPNIKTQTGQDLTRKKMSFTQHFALNNLLEKLLKRCDDIIKNPAHKLYQQEPMANPPASFVTLKRFQDFQHLSTEQLFLKYYKFLTKTQNTACFFPKNFDAKTYLETTELDHFFESSSTPYNEDDLLDVTDPIHLHLSPTILKLAKLADKLENELQIKNEKTESDLKRHRVETQLA